MCATRSRHWLTASGLRAHAGRGTSRLLSGRWCRVARAELSSGPRPGPRSVAGFWAAGYFSVTRRSALPDRPAEPRTAADSQRRVGIAVVIGIWGDALPVIGRHARPLARVSDREELCS